jgi:hypothetical protein
MEEHLLAATQSHLFSYKVYMHKIPIILTFDLDAAWDDESDWINSNIILLELKEPAYGADLPPEKQLRTPPPKRSRTGPWGHTPVGPAEYDVYEAALTREEMQLQAAPAPPLTANEDERLLDDLLADFSDPGDEEF